MFRVITSIFGRRSASSVRVDTLIELLIVLRFVERQDEVTCNFFIRSSIPEINLISFARVDESCCFKSVCLRISKIVLNIGSLTILSAKFSSNHKIRGSDRDTDIAVIFIISMVRVFDTSWIESLD